MQPPRRLAAWTFILALPVAGCELIGGIDDKRLGASSTGVGASGSSSSSSSSSSGAGGSCSPSSPCNQHDCGPLHQDCIEGECPFGVCQAFVFAHATNPSAIAVDDGAVYWNDEGPMGIRWCPKDGCHSSPMPMVDAVSIGALVTSGGFVNFTIDAPASGGSIARCPSMSILCSLEGIEKPLGTTLFMDLDDAAVYYPVPSVGLRRTPLPMKSGMTTVLVAGVEVGPVALDDTRAYYIERASGAVGACTKSDACATGPQAITPASFAALPSGLAARLVGATTSLFMVGHDGIANVDGIFQCDTSSLPCTLSKLSSFTQPVAAFGVDRQPVSGPQFVYFAPLDPGNMVPVLRAVVGGGDQDPPVQIAASEASPVAFAEDDFAVYWVDSVSGNVMKAIK